MTRLQLPTVLALQWAQLRAHFAKLPRVLTLLWMTVLQLPMVLVLIMMTRAPQSSYRSDDTRPSAVQHTIDSLSRSAHISIIGLRILLRLHKSAGSYRLSQFAKETSRITTLSDAIRHVRLEVLTCTNAAGLICISRSRMLMVRSRVSTPSTVADGAPTAKASVSEFC